MVDSFTSNYNFTLPEVGASDDTWGPKLNGNWTSVDSIVAGKAPLASPVLTGDPKAPTPATADNDTSIATTAFVKAQGYLTAVPGTYAPLASPVFTGDPQAPTPSAADNDTSISTTAFVKTAIATKIDEAPSDNVQYVRKNAAWSPVSVPPGTYIGDTAPSSPSAGQLWFESDTGNTFIWYDDGNTQQWVQINVGTGFQGPISVDAPIDGQLYLRKNGAWVVSPGTAQARNRVCNGAMQISQENLNTSSTVNGYHVADQWRSVFGTTGTVTAQRVQSATPNGSKDRYRVTATVADISLAAGELLVMEQPIEGSRMADFRYGNVAAKQSVLRFGFKAPAGTYSIALNNAAANRSYVANFTITAGQAGTDTEQTFVIPGDITGTWATDTGLGVALRVTIASGSATIGVAGWQAGNFLATSSNTNGLANAGNVFELFDVGWYLDPSSTGVPPKWEMPDEAQELIACQRYYSGKHANMIAAGIATAASQSAYLDTFFPTSMRITPAVSATNFLNNNTGGVTNSATTTTHLRMTTTSSGAGLFYSQFDLTLNARL